MHLPIVDLHCDLLSFLEENPHKEATDPISNCSLVQMQKGGIILQVLAIFSETKKGSTISSAEQAKIFKDLSQKYPQIFPRSQKKRDNSITILPALENASTILEEEENFDMGAARITTIHNEIGPILYVSLTWNEENCFGGGNETSVGLKKKGKKLLDLMNKNNISVDLSHSSDPLAYDILEYIEKKNLSIIPIASHSNFRKICNQRRNLSDEIAQQIIKKKGIIGLNCVRNFVGSSLHDFISHIEHAISLNGENNLSLGADFLGRLAHYLNLIT